MTTKVNIRKLEKRIVRLISERDTALAMRDAAIGERDEAIARAQEVEKEKQSLEKENLEMKKKLAFYEGPNTPPSQETLKKKKEKKKTKNKRGAPKGHKGATRKVPEPEEIIPVSADHCPRCGCTNIRKTKRKKKKVVEELVDPPKIKTTQYDLDEGECLDCGLVFTSEHKDCPKVGNFGVYLLTLIVMLKFFLRGPLRKVEEFLAHFIDFKISTKGLMDILLRVGEACKKEYERIHERVKGAAWRYIDETSMSVLGKKWWLWIFRTNTDDVLVVIRRFRGRKVLHEILGKKHVGPDVVDGWGAYVYIKLLQRCWSHLLRKADAFIDVSNHGKRLSEELHSIFDKIKIFLDKGPPMDERKRWKEKVDREMKALADRYSKFKELSKVVTYIQGGLGKWATCFLYPGMEPTNNLAEQAVREHVIIRKIIGCFRSENGSQNYQYIASLLATWRLQGKDMFVELEKLLRRELCMA